MAADRMGACMWFLGLGAAVVGASCGDDSAPFFSNPRVAPAICGRAADVVCIGEEANYCGEGTTPERRVDCAASGQVCVRDRGCLVCPPATRRCEGSQVFVCNREGSAWEEGPVCNAEEDMYCSPIGCSDLCRSARNSRSYLGCEYWPTTTLNSRLSKEFEFAVAVANPQLVDAEIAITRGGSPVASATVAPGSLETIRLPWVDELRTAGIRDPEAPGAPSVLVRQGAYRLRSNVPVTVYQFNPLDFRVPRDCEDPHEDPTDDEQCFSFTNDASLLFPTHALTGNYLVGARPSHEVVFTEPDRVRTLRSPGFVAVVATDANTTVRFHTTAHTAASTLAGAVPSREPGQVIEAVMQAGDVLQVTSATPADCTKGERSTRTMSTRQGPVEVASCLLPGSYDLTGSLIESSAPISVIAGHDCTFVPFQRAACDHLEESLVPLEAWGRELVIGATRPLRNEPNVVRILSGEDGNLVEFEPAVHESAMLDRGQFIEFELRQSIQARGTGRLAAMQFLVGQEFFGLGTSGAQSSGDPAMAFAIPKEQFRTEYIFLTPASYDISFVGVVAESHELVILDGELVVNFDPIGQSGLVSANARLEPGVHRIEGTKPFGITVYGFGAFTSYLYPGGLNLQEIGPFL